MYVHIFTFTSHKNNVIHFHSLLIMYFLGLAAGGMSSSFRRSPTDQMDVLTLCQSLQHWVALLLCSYDVERNKSKARKGEGIDLIGEDVARFGPGRNISEGGIDWLKELCKLYNEMICNKQGMITMGQRLLNMICRYNIILYTYILYNYSISFRANIYVIT